jgi:signal transduction histidine kinase/CheY-like chemotaxis protein
MLATLRSLVPSARWLRRWGPAVPVLFVSILGVMLSLYAFRAWRAVEMETARNDFRAAATRRLASLRRDLAKPLDAMKFIETLFEAVGVVDEDEFDKFAGELLRDNPAIREVIWAPPGLADSAGPAAQTTPDRLVVRYALPRVPDDAIGRDIRDRPEYKACLETAPVSSRREDRLCLSREGNDIAIVAILPIARLGVHDDGATDAGIIAARVNLRLPDTAGDGSSVEIFDIDHPNGVARLISGESFDIGPEIPENAVFQNLPVGGTHWRLANIPAIVGTGSPSRRSLLVLAGCLAVTANLAVYILLILRRRQRIEVTVRDRTVELEVALGELRRSEQRLQDYITTASDWYWETDRKLRFTHVGDQARVYGIDPDHLVGIDRLTADDAANDVAERAGHLAAHEMFRDMRYEYGAEHGLLTLSLSGLPIFGPDGAFLGYRGSARDITEQLQIETKQRQARWVAEQANRAKSNFLATMSHEIRTPMNGVLGMVQVLSDTALDDEQRRMCDVIWRSGQALHQILNDILDYSKLEAGRITLEAIATSLLEVVDGVVDLMRGTAEAKGLTVTVEAIDGGPPPVMVDPTRLRQVLFNLVSNAIKFSARGSVAIRLRGTDLGFGHVAVVLEVADQGIGISQEARRKLFTRFSQADGTTTRRYGGTGLGLAITKQLVTLMGGSIDVDSVLGEGTTFTIRMTLPIAARVETSGTPPRWTEQAVNARILDILVVEDNDINQEVIASMLRGHRLTMASDGMQAISAVRGGSFDVVLMDVMMPVMNGMEATREIRALNAPGAGAPIIALTANSMSGDREQYLAAGMTDYVSKPIERENLFNAIERVIGEPVWRPLAAATTAVAAKPAVSRAAEQQLEDFLAHLDG